MIDSESVLRFTKALASRERAPVAGCCGCPLLTLYALTTYPSLEEVQNLSNRMSMPSKRGGTHAVSGSINSKISASSSL